MSERTGCGQRSSPWGGSTSGAEGEVGGAEERAGRAERAGPDGDGTDRSLQRRAEPVERPGEAAADHHEVGIELGDDGSEERSRAGCRDR